MTADLAVLDGRDWATLLVSAIVGALHLIGLEIWIWRSRRLRRWVPGPDVAISAMFGV